MTRKLPRSSLMRLDTPAAPTALDSRHELELFVEKRMLFWGRLCTNSCLLLG